VLAGRAVTPVHDRYPVESQNALGLDVTRSATATTTPGTQP
jgi:hypothetical protein